VSADRPHEADAERQALWAKYGVGRIAEAPEGWIAVRTEGTEAVDAFRAWGEKWGVQTPDRIERFDDHCISYYKIPELEHVS
jgi:hypothetical protein